MNKFFRDTTMVVGKYSQKRIMTYLSFVVAVIYSFIPIFKPEFEVKEFVFLGFLTIGGWTLYRTQKVNENLSPSNNINLQNTASNGITED